MGAEEHLNGHEKSSTSCGSLDISLIKYMNVRRMVAVKDQSPPSSQCEVLTRPS